VPLSLYFDFTASVTDCAKAVLTSPVAWMCAGHFFERWVYAAINEAVDTSVVRPDHPDIVSPEADSKHRITTILGLRPPSPPFVRRAVHGLFMALGWGATCDTEDPFRSHLPDSADQTSLAEGQTIDVGGTTITNVTPLELALAQPHHAFVNVSDMEAQVAAVDATERPRTPVTPLASEAQYDDADPRIRITNREGIVEMEVRLPPRILFTHTELVDDIPDSQNPQNTQSRPEALGRTDRTQHRVSELSLESSRMASAIVKSQLLGLAMLPVKFVVLRLVVQHYYAGNSDPRLSRAVIPLPTLKDLSWRSVGIQLSRLALCNALEIAVNLVLWGIQYGVTLNIGISRFGWGDL
jgi:hypothetical protein